MRECGFKIKRVGPGFVALAGDVQAGNNFVARIATLYHDGHSLPDAFSLVAARAESTVEQHCYWAVSVPGTVGKSPSEVTVFKAGRSPKLRSLEVGEQVVLGSVLEEKPILRSIAAMSAFLHEINAAGEIKLGIMQGLLTALELQNDLMRVGVGGAIAGAIADARGTRWHEDILYLVVDDSKTSILSVSSYVRDNHHCVWSTEVRGTRVFLSSNPTGGFERWASDQTSFSPGHRGHWPRLLCVLHARRPTVLIVDMNNDPVHPLVVLESMADLSAVGVRAGLKAPVLKFILQPYDAYSLNTFRARIGIANAASTDIAEYHLESALDTVLRE